MVGVEVRLEVVRDEVVVAVVADGRDEGAEVLRVAEVAALDRLEHLAEGFVHRVLAPEPVRVPQVLNVLRQVAEQEDVLLPHLPRDLDVGPVARADDEPTVEHELHVASS